MEACIGISFTDTLNRAIDQLPKGLTMVIEAKGGHVEFRLNYALEIILVLQVSMKINQNSCVIVKINAILGDLCKLGK